MNGLIALNTAGLALILGSTGYLHYKQHKYNNSYKLPDIEIPPTVHDVPVNRNKNYRVERVVNGRTWDIYNGEDGGSALRLFESIKHSNERGSTYFYDDEVVRGSHLGPN